MIGDLYNAYIEFTFKIIANIGGRIYLAPIYVLGFIIPKAKELLLEYENNASNKSIFLISNISSIIFCSIIYTAIPEFAKTVISKFLWYVLYVIGGYFILFFFADYKEKQKIS